MFSVLRHLMSFLWSPVYCLVAGIGESDRDREAEQVKNFQSLGLNRCAGLEALNAALSGLEAHPYSEDEEMSSEHLVLFGAISLRHKEFRSVFEIGTFDARSAVVLGRLFPNAIVTTIDLPQVEEVGNVAGVIPRSTQLLSARDERLSFAHNVRFIEMNSLRLTESENVGHCDLVWVDGDHTYPVSAVDVANAVRLLKPGGYLLCDDIIMKNSRLQGPYLSTAGFDTLSSMDNAQLLSSPTLIRKRIGRWHQYPPRYIAVCTRLMIE